MPPVAVPPLDLHAQFREIEADVRAAIDRVLASQRFVQGPEAALLEREVGNTSGVAHAVAVSSGTDAILVSLMALGVGPGDEVVTTPYTFVSSVTSIARLGARPVFVDIDSATFNVDASRLDAAITARTKVLLPVHLFGQMADMSSIARIAEARGVLVVEDAAQAIGAERDGIKVGQSATAATLSFFPSKNLGAMGDAGMVLTDDAAFAARVRMLRNHGQEPKYSCQAIGGNFRMDELQAAILRAKLPYLERWTRARATRAEQYRDAFAAKGIAEDRLKIPVVRESTADRHVYNQLVVRVPGSGVRDALRAHLEAQGIGTAIYYPVPMHLQPAFAHLGHAVGAFPQAERASLETLALPLYPELTESAIAAVVDAVHAFFARRA